MPSAIFETYLETWTNTRSKEVSKYERPNFVSTDIALDSFEMGEKSGKKKFEEELKKRFFDMLEENMKISATSGTNIVNVLLENKLDAYKLFIDATPDYSKVIITVNPKQHYTEKFEKIIEPLIRDIEKKYYDIDQNIEIITLDESDHLDLEKLKHDGYSFAFDIVNQQGLY